MIDSFNFPLYFPSQKQLKAIIERNGSYNIERMETLDNPGKHTLTSAKARALFYRAVFDKLLINHFGCEIIDEKIVSLFLAGVLGSYIWAYRQSLGSLNGRFSTLFGIECGSGSVARMKKCYPKEGRGFDQSSASSDPNLCYRGVSLSRGALVDHSRGDWNMESLSVIFLLMDIEAILVIPLGKMNQSDLIVWHYTNDARFSVMSPYHLACSLTDGASSSGAQFWKFI
ncbi:hypothetical protein Sango_0094200 [Sesamum angolense]|uniref:Uncharacterized protein n=1 Tax=Sesamum angolense TaxID=2727404 RepID=A0AAE1XE14_9LAMI|nr:hypothetical protein Sango_0094200 [Sesamum angolense]